MRDYGKVHTSFWTSSNIHSLSDDGRMLALYLLTCPHGTIAGVFRLPDGYACEDLQWEPNRVKTTLSELSNNGFATRCEVTKWVWVIKHFEWNPPENPNQRKSAAKMADQVPDSCSWKVDFIEKCGIYFDANTKKTKPLSNPSETLSQPVTVTVTGTVEDSSDLLSQSEQPLTDFSIPLVDSTVYKVPVKEFEMWSQAYPAVNVGQELLQMAAWVSANPTKRKTRRGVCAFAVRWLSKAQDMPSGRSPPAAVGGILPGAI